MHILALVQCIMKIINSTNLVVLCLCRPRATSLMQVLFSNKRHVRTFVSFDASILTILFRIAVNAQPVLVTAGSAVSPDYPAGTSSAPQDTGKKEPNFACIIAELKNVLKTTCVRMNVSANTAIQILRWLNG